jgi:hypothetical protein
VAPRGAAARHVEREGAQHAVGQQGVVGESAAEARAPGLHPAVGVELEGRLAAVEGGSDVIGGELEQG